MSWDDQLDGLVRRTKAERAAAEQEKEARKRTGLPPSGNPLVDNSELADLRGGASNEGDEPYNPWKAI